MSDYVEMADLRAAIQVTPEVFADSFDFSGIIARTLAQGVDRMLNPWNYADRNPFPRFDPVPRFTRWQGHAREARARLNAAVEVLRHGAPEPEDY